MNRRHIDPEWKKRSLLPHKDLLILLVLAIFMRSLWLSAVVERDEGALGYAGWLIAHPAATGELGEDNNFPLTRLVYAGLITLFGNTILPMKLLNHLLFVLSVPIFYNLVERSFNRITAFVAALVYVAAMNTPAFEGPLAKVTSFATPFMVLAIYFLVKSHFSSRGLHLGLSVCCLTIAFLFRITMGFGFLLFLGDVSLTALHARQSGISKEHPGILAFLWGITALFFGAMAFLFQFSGGHLSAVVSYLKLASLSFLAPFLELRYPQPVGMFILEGLFILLLLPPGIVALWRFCRMTSEPKRTIYKVFLLWFFISSVITFMPPMFGYFYLHLVPPASLIAGLGLMHIVTRLNSRTTRIFAIGALSIMIIISYYYQGLHYPHFNSPAVRAKWGGDWTYSDIPTYQDQLAIARFIKASVGEEERIVIWGNAPEIYFLSERKNPGLGFRGCLEREGRLPEHFRLPAPGMSHDEITAFIRNAYLGRRPLPGIPTVEYTSENLEMLLMDYKPEKVEAILIIPTYERVCQGFDRPVFADFVKNWTKHEIGGAAIYTRPGDRISIEGS